MEKDKGEDPGAGGCLLQRAGSPSRGVVLGQWGSGHRSAAGSGHGGLGAELRASPRPGHSWASMAGPAAGEKPDLIFSVAVFIGPVNEEMCLFNRGFCQKIFLSHIFFTSMYQNRLFRILTLGVFISIIFSCTMNLNIQDMRN